MVIHKQVKKRAGIAMIELIFALVIMGIVLMSAPMLIQQSIRSGNVALQQEAIVAAASQTAIILSMHWDENNNTNTVGVAPMLDVDRPPFNFDATNVPVGQKNGVTGRNSRLASGLTYPESNLSTFGQVDAGEIAFDDVDDYHNRELNLSIFGGQNTTADIGDYVDVDLNITTLINYTEDRIATGDMTDLSNTAGRLVLNNNLNPTSLGISTNIKFIQVNLTSNSGVEEYRKDITFQAFSCNIGTTLTQGSTEL